MIWTTIKIGDLGRIVTGKTPPTKQREYFGGDYPFITPTDLEYDGYRVGSTMTTVSDEAKTKFPNQFIPKNAITYTCIASVGKIGVATMDSLTNQQINSIVPSDKHDWRFVYYLLRHESRRIKAMHSGVAVPIINKRDFERIQIKVPIDLATEQKIGSILAAYDDLIENNHRRIELLEKAARVIYEEWFIRLRFPGHENTRIVDGVPARWNIGTVDDLVRQVKVNFTDHDKHLPLVDLSRIGRKTLSVINTGLSSDIETSRIIFEEDDILFNSIRPYLHKVVLAPFKGITNVSVFVIRPKSEILRAYTTILLSENYSVAYANQHATGTKMPVVKYKLVAAMPIVIPPQAILEKYQEIAGALLEEIKLLCLANQKLSQARDMLLPKLMKGEIGISGYHV